MEMPSFGKPVFAGAATLILSLTTQAALTAVDIDGDWGNGHEGVYDDALDITWLADANYAQTSGYDADGLMTWADAEAFVTSLNAENGGDGYLDVKTWRQPKVAPLDGTSFNLTITYDGSSDQGYQLTAAVDATYNPNGQSASFTGSELAYHYYNSFEAIGACYGSGTTESACQSESVYGIDDAPDPNGYNALFSNLQNNVYWTGTELDSPNAFFFNTINGFQNIFEERYQLYVWVVADGMVGNAIPLPSATWLFGSALFGLIGLKRRQ